MGTAFRRLSGESVNGKRSPGVGLTRRPVLQAWRLAGQLGAGPACWLAGRLGGGGVTGG